MRGLREIGALIVACLIGGALALLEGLAIGVPQ